MKALLALSGLFCLASSCAISMKMPANQFESSEVYGKTGLRTGLSYRGQSNLELTPNQTLRAPDTETPEIGPTHVLGANSDVGIGKRVEVTYTLLDLLTGKVQLLGDSKQTATAGNISLSIAGTIGGLKNTEEDTAWFSTRRYRTEMHRTVYGVLV